MVMDTCAWRHVTRVLLVFKPNVCKFRLNIFKQFIEYSLYFDQSLYNYALLIIIR